jgi:predicted nucleic acid-binding Zn ribbon protein
MEPLHRTATDSLRALLAGQPASPAKVAFAWRVAAGAAFGRAGEPEWRDGVLIVRARTDAWRRELRRAGPVLTARLQDLVGADIVRQIVIE